MLKFVGLVIGLLAKFVTGSIFVFNVYQDKIKQTFNYTQKEGKVYWMTRLSVSTISEQRSLKFAPYITKI